MTNDIELDFRADASEIESLLDADLSALPAGALAWAYLNLPVRFVIGGMNVLRPEGPSRNDWLVTPDGAVTGSDSVLVSMTDARRLPILAFATALDSAIQQANSEGIGVSTVPDGGSLRFERRDGGVLVVTEASERVTADFADVVEAIKRFHESVAELVRRNLGPLSQNGDLRAWFDEPRDET